MPQARFPSRWLPYEGGVERCLYLLLVHTENFEGFQVLAISPTPTVDL
jgi:hypothetical protein